MKCPECQSQDMVSVVRRLGPRISTLMMVDTYWDEDGKMHIHDPNRTVDWFRCSNGHEWSKQVNRCPAKDCEWNQHRPMVETSQ